MIRHNIQIYWYFVDKCMKKNALLIIKNMLSCIRYFIAFVKGVCHGK